MSRPVIIISDLLADLVMHIPAFPINSTELVPVTYMELGPGGACNTAIMAARLGLRVACLGEVGYDAFGEAVLEGLQQEGIDVAGVVVSPGISTPVASVIVDAAAEPAYLGYPGSLRLAGLPDAWRPVISSGAAVFADGWAENEGVIA